MKTAAIYACLAVCATSVLGALHPAFPTETCNQDGCTVDSTFVVLDKEAKVTDASQYEAKGVTISGNNLKLKLTNGEGPRVYIAKSDSAYRMYQMIGKELAYDVEISQLDCNMNGALYFIQMPETGAEGGTGYCDANGVGGEHCPEMDIWEANKYANVMTTHPTAYDSNGCGYNPYSQGSKSLYGFGSGFSVDTSKTFTVVTQFLTSGSSSSVSEIKRLYVQNGKTVQGGSLTSSCNVGAMGAAMNNGSVLAMSVWYSTGMGWLDANGNGPCPTGSTSKDAVVTFSNIRVGDIGTTTGPNSTKTKTPVPTSEQPTVTPTPSPSGPTPTPSEPTPTPTQSPTKGTVPKWGQCGGINYKGDTVCAEGTCTKLNDWYYQCL